MLSGTRVSYKNASLFFEAFALLGDARGLYQILCTGGGELSPTMRALAGPATVQVSILSDADMAAAYSGATALVYPSLYEGVIFRHKGASCFRHIGASCKRSN
jgi:glycosyltransferase involved in cell wall biosynthesis